MCLHRGEPGRREDSRAGLPGTDGCRIRKSGSREKIDKLRTVCIGIAEREVDEMENNKPSAIVRVHRPELTDEEKERRLKQIRMAAANLVIATERERRKSASALGPVS